MTSPLSLIGEEAVKAAIMEWMQEGYFPSELDAAARAAISAHLAALKEAGWACVPREPTEKMRRAGRENNYARYADAAWEAMVEAAPPVQNGDHDIIGKQQEEPYGP